jgi:hypothetical protein
MSVEPIGRGAPAPLSFDHLRRLSDDTGLLEHALGRVPRRREGYTTDDNTRALWLVTEWLSLREEAGLSGADVRLLEELAGVYLAFLLWNQEEDGWWHNNVAYDRTWEPEERSHDCQGRAVWACADAWIRLPLKERGTAYFMLQRALRTLDGIESLRGQAYALAACAHLLEAAEAGAIECPAEWTSQLAHHLVRLEKSLVSAFRSQADGQWDWFEPVMTYANGLLPWALLRACRVTGHPEALETGLRSLRFLLRCMTAPEGWLRPVGNAGWAAPGSVSRWDQQPLELFKLALALDEAETALRRLDGAAGGAAAGAAGGGTGAVPGGVADVAAEGAVTRGAANIALESAVTRGAAGVATEDAAAGGLAGIAAEDAAAGGLFGVAGGAAADVTAGRAAAAAAGGVASRAAAVATVGMAGAVSPEVRSLPAALDRLREMKMRCLQWFDGYNDLGVPMADPWDGSCSDGLQADGPNRNCGAEATISYLMTRALCLKGRAADGG